MKVAILGAGGIGLGYTAFLTDSGHEVVVRSPSGAGTEAFKDGAPLQASGSVTGSFALSAARCDEAVGFADVVILALPSNGHRTAIDAASAHLRDGQTVIISSHASMGALYASKRLAERGIDVPVVAWGTTFLTARRAGDTQVDISNIRAKVDTATLPASANEHGLETCRALFGDRFEPRSDVMAIALSNFNPIAHMANALCNLTRMERGEDWANYDGITGAVGRLMEALDLERLAIARAYGAKVRTIQEHYKISFDVDGDSIAEMASIVHARRGGPPGPKTLDTRFVLEDVPYGLFPCAAIAATANVPAPLHEAGIDLFSALYGRDFRAENDILPELAFDRLNAEQIGRMAREGWKAA